MIGLHKHSLSAGILLRLGNATEKRHLEAVSEKQLFSGLETTKNAPPSWQLRRTLRRMKEAGYITFKINTKKKLQTIMLTERGRIELLRHRIMEGTESWDGKWRVMIFDIPEERRRHRDFLRRKLQWLGFKELQRSIWIIPYDVRNQMNELFSLLGVQIKGDIRFMLIERLEHDDDIKKIFNLK